MAYWPMVFDSFFVFACSVSEKSDFEFSEKLAILGEFGV
jgi:hypothetical protein